MLIKELAAASDLSIDTIRFYEKQGLLDTSHFVRTVNGYRHYNATALQRLTLIRQAQAAGITLSELRESVDTWESGEFTSEEKVVFFHRKLEQIDARIASLQGIKAYIEEKLTWTGNGRG